MHLAPPQLGPTNVDRNVDLYDLSLRFRTRDASPDGKFSVFWVPYLLLGMAQTAIPPTPDALLERLAAVFPMFVAHTSDDDAQATSFHSVMMEFTVFFGRAAQSASAKQLRALSELILEATAHPGELENAIGTCFLEHLHQIQAEKVLRPFLNEANRRARHA